MKVEGWLNPCTVCGSSKKGGKAYARHAQRHEAPWRAAERVLAYLIKTALTGDFSSAEVALW